MKWWNSGYFRIWVAPRRNFKVSGAEKPSKIDPWDEKKKKMRFVRITNIIRNSVGFLCEAIQINIHIGILIIRTEKEGMDQGRN